MLTKPRSPNDGGWGFHVLLDQQVHVGVQVHAERFGVGLYFVPSLSMRSSIALVMKSFRLSPTASAAACISDLWPFGTNGISELSAQRKAQYEDYRKAKTNMLEWAATKNNMERILRTTDKEKRVLSSLW